MTAVAAAWGFQSGPPLALPGKPFPCGTDREGKKRGRAQSPPLQTISRMGNLAIPANDLTLARQRSTRALREWLIEKFIYLNAGSLSVSSS